MKTSNPIRRRYQKDSPICVLDGTRDIVTGTELSCSIDGTRYGIVDSVVTSFGPNVVPIVDIPGMPGIKGLRGCPAWTQYFRQTETVNTSSQWSKDSITIPSVLTHSGVAMYRVRETTANSPHRIKHTSEISVADNSVVGISFVAKYDGRSLYVVYRQKNTGFYRYAGIFDLESGVVSDLREGVKVSADIWPIGDDYYQCWLAINVGSGSYATTLYPEFYTVINDVVTFSYVGDTSKGAYIGKLTLVNYGVNGALWIPPYIPNTTTSSLSVVSEVGSSTNGTSFDLDTMDRVASALRGPNAQGHIEFTFVSNFNSDDIPENESVNIITTRDNKSSLFYFEKETGGATFFKSYDGSNPAASIASTVANGSEYLVALDFNSSGFILSVNGVSTLLMTFSGTWGDSDLRHFYGNTIHAGWIKDGSLRVYNRPRW